jgi:hypothetical protein
LSVELVDSFSGHSRASLGEARGNRLMNTPFRKHKFTMVLLKCCIIKCCYVSHSSSQNLYT